MDVNVKKVISLLKENAPTPELEIEDARKKLTYAYRQISSELVETEVDLPHCKATLFSLPNQQQETALLFAHGGGFNIGSTADHVELIRRFVLTADMPVLSVDYHLAPESLYPAQLDDMLDGYRYLLDQKIKPSNIGFFGISAGAILTLASLQRVTELKWPQPGVALVMSPLTDFTNMKPSCDYNADNDWIAKPRLLSIPGVFLPESMSVNDPLVSPLFGDYTQSPPTLIQVGDNELLLDDNLNFYQKQRQKNCDFHLEVWRDMVHCWQIFSRFVPQGQQAIEQGCQFLRSHMEAFK